jgi:hypothetical protein
MLRLRIDCHRSKIEGEFYVDTIEVEGKVRTIVWGHYRSHDSQIAATHSKLFISEQPLHSAPTFPSGAMEENPKQEFEVLAKSKCWVVELGWLNAQHLLSKDRELLSEFSESGNSCSDNSADTTLSYFCLIFTF